MITLRDRDFSSVRKFRAKSGLYFRAISEISGGIVAAKRRVWALPEQMSKTGFQIPLLNPHIRGFRAGFNPKKGEIFIYLFEHSSGKKPETPGVPPEIGPIKGREMVLPNVPGRENIMRGAN